MATPGVPPAAAPARNAVPQRPEYPQVPPRATPTAATTQGAPAASAPPPGRRRTTGAAEGRRARCCGRCLGGHTTEEAGLSFWIHPFLLAATRFASAAFLIFTANFLIRDNTPGWVLGFISWLTVLEAASFLLLGVCTVAASLGKPVKFVANVAVPLHQTAVTCAVFVFPFVVYYTANYWLPVFALVFIPQVAFFLLDAIVLGARVRFRYVYMWFALVCIAVYIIAMFSVMAALGGVFAIGVVVAAVAVSIIWCVVAGLIVTAMTRLSGCIAGRAKPRGEMAEVTAPATSNV